MSKPVVFVLDPYHPEVLQLLRSTPSVETVYRDNPQSHNWRDEATAIMIRSETSVMAADLAQVKKLKVIVKQGVGVDNIDLDAAKAHNISVCNTPALNSESVAELTLGMALCISRRINELDRRIRGGEVILRSTALGMSLYRKTIGIIGMGNIGKAVAKKWTGAMEGQIIGYDPFAGEGMWPGIDHRRVTSLEELLQEADVVSLHVPLTKDTKGMISTPQLRQMKTTSILINCARGGIIDENALLEALMSNEIYGAALDAMEVEPPTLQAYDQLLRNGNLVMTPHVGANTVENQIISGTAVAETVLAVLEGREVPNRLV